MSSAMGTLTHVLNLDQSEVFSHNDGGIFVNGHCGYPPLSKRIYNDMYSSNKNPFKEFYEKFEKKLPLSAALFQSGITKPTADYKSIVKKRNTLSLITHHVDLIS